jgi:hypothetical protein
MPEPASPPGHRPLSRPLDFVLHIGPGKTGTSSIQFFLAGNRERLGELGYLYPRSPGAARHTKLGLFIKSEEELQSVPAWYRQKQSDPTQFRRAFRRQFFSEVESSGLSRVLCSDEALFHSSRPALRRLRRFTDRVGRSVRLVTYLRRQDDHFISRYQQLVKTGEVRRLDEWVQDDWTPIYDYDACIRRHEEMLEPATFVVRRFEPGSFVDGSLHQDFLDAAGVDARAEDLAQVPDRNESLDAESVELLRLLNLYRVENEGATARLIDNRKLVSRLVELSNGPVLTLPEPVLDEFMSRWEKPNEAVARRCLGDSSGALFRTPRRTRNTTTEQRFDPVRLGDYLDVLELPEQAHRALRQVVEREARAR